MVRNISSLDMKSSLLDLNIKKFLIIGKIIINKNNMNIKIKAPIPDIRKTQIANLHEWVRVSLGAPFIRPCATSEQRAL